MMEAALANQALIDKQLAGEARAREELESQLSRMCKEASADVSQELQAQRVQQIEMAEQMIQMQNLAQFWADRLDSLEKIHATTCEEMRSQLGHRLNTEAKAQEGLLQQITRLEAAQVRCDDAIRRAGRFEAKQAQLARMLEEEKRVRSEGLEREKVARGELQASLSRNVMTRLKHCLDQEAAARGEHRQHIEALENGLEKLALRLEETREEMLNTHQTALATDVGTWQAGVGFQNCKTKREAEAHEQSVRVLSRCAPSNKWQSPER